jgi:transcriptional repressor NrdR
MKCPYCTHIHNKVIDSRLTKDHYVIRRRRECLGCGKRFTTYERIEEILPLVIKKDGRREPFDRAKIVSGMKKACEKRPVSITTIERAVDKIEQGFQEKGGQGDRELQDRRKGDGGAPRDRRGSPMFALPRSTASSGTLRTS